MSAEGRHQFRFLFVGVVLRKGLRGKAEQEQERELHRTARHRNHSTEWTVNSPRIPLRLAGIARDWLDRSRVQLEDTQMSLTRSEGYFKGYKDTQLFRQSWKFGEKPRWVLVITHGLGEHSDAYERFAQGVGMDGLHIYAYDLRGHGRSEGRWGVVERFSEYRKDLVMFFHLLRREQDERGLNPPFFLLGHSMGGLITASTVIREEIQGMSGVVLSAPLMDVAVQVPVLKEKAGRFLEKWFPNQTLYNEVKYENLSRDREILKTYQRDPLRHDRISLRLYTELQDEMPFVRLGASRFHEPLLLQHGTNDHIADPGAAKTFCEKASSKDKTIKLYDGAFHEAYNDLGREQVFADFQKWLEKR